MTWHLKDQELEKKIIAIDPEFLKRLHINQEILFSPLPSIEPSLLLTHEMLKGAPKYEFELRTKKGILGKLVFDECDLEDIPEYNPKAWNEYPKVTPPENVWMRLEIFRAEIRSQGTYRDAAIFLAGKWRNGEGVIEIREDDEVRFRLWED